MIFYAEYIRYGFHVFLHLSIHLTATIIGKELSTHHVAYYKLASYPFRMAELGLVDYFVMGEAIGIVATFIAGFLFFKKANAKALS